MINKIWSFIKKEILAFAFYVTNFVLIILFVFFFNLSYLFLTNRNYDDVSVGISLLAFFGYLYGYYKFSSLVVENKKIKLFFISLQPILYAFLISLVAFYITYSTELSGFIGFTIFMFYLLFFILKKMRK